jgi:hypothetical protein
VVRLTFFCSKYTSMLSGYLLEYFGTLLICATLLLTNANPYMVGLSHTAALLIGEGKVLGHFSLLNVIIQYFMKRVTLRESLKIAAIQLAAALSVIVLYIPFAE